MGEGATVQCSKCYTLNPPDSRVCGKCGSSLGPGLETLTCDEPGGEGSAPPPLRFVPGQVFDHRYRIIEEIGRGGMGCVFKAEDTELDITVALKIIRPRLSSDPRFVELFKREMLLARSISHESVIRIFDLGDAPGAKYISMEFIKGENLKEFLRSSGTLAVETVFHLARQIGEALRAAHAKGIVHQDLKPSNVMVDQGGRAHVMDFGLAQAVQAAGSGAGSGAGTPQYMSPEQARGERTTPRSDIYSFGAVLYELAAGRPVFEAATRAELRTKHLSERPVPPSRHNPRIPGALERIILKCLDKDPGRRYGSIDEVLADLERAEAAVSRPFIDWLRRHAHQALALLALTVVSLVATKLFIEPRPPSKRPSLAVMYLTNNTGDPGLDYMRRMLAEALIADLLQSRYVRVLTPDRIFGLLTGLGLADAPAYATEDLKRVASKAKVNYILQGSFAKAQDQVRVQVSLHDASRLEPLATCREQWSHDEDLFAAIESLSRKVKQGLNVPASALDGDIHKDLRTITTGSPEAFKHYVEGKRLYEERKFGPSLEVLKKAVAIDPGFAMAYRLMSENCGYLRDGAGSKDMLDKALALLDRVSDREFYFIRSYAASSLEEAVDMHKKLLRLYPDDVETLLEMGAAYRNMEDWPQAARAFEKVLEVDETSELAYENLAIVSMAQGRLKKAIELLESKRGDFGDWVGYRLRLATAYLSDRRFDQALEEARRAAALDPSDFEPCELEGFIHLLRGDHDQAESCFRRMLESSDPTFHVVARHWLCHLYLAGGRYGRAQEEVQAALEHAGTAEMSEEMAAAERHLMAMVSAHIALRSGRLGEALGAAEEALEQAGLTKRGDHILLANHFRGLVLARMGLFDEARAAARAIEDLVKASGIAREIRYRDLLLGEIALAEGDAARAVRFLESAVRLLPEEHYKTDLHILLLDPLASALSRQGDMKRALGAYERISSLMTGRLRWGDLHSLSFLERGRLYQDKGRKGKAIECYRRFLELWRSADPDRPELEAARKALAALGAGPAPR